MSIRTRVSMGTLALSLALALVAFSESSLAQRDAGAKMRGEVGRGYWSGRSAQLRMRHARDYAGGAFDYTARAPRVQRPVVRTEAAEVDRNIQAARERLKKLRAEIGESEELLAALARVEKHLAAAMEHHEALCTQCDAADATDEDLMHCCNDVITELDLALAEHAALMRKLIADPLPDEDAAPRN